MTISPKQLILPLILLLALPASRMAAQRHYIPHVHVGVHGGMSLSNQSFYPSIKESMLSGAQFGVSFRYAEERHVGLLAELNIEQRGWKENFEEDPFSFQRQLTYIELPIMTHIFFGSRTVKGFFNLGPEVGYMIGDKSTANFPYMDLPAVDGFPAIRRRNSITLEGRYYYGLGNIFPSSRKDVFSASRGSSIQITLGYLFRLK